MGHVYQTVTLSAETDKEVSMFLDTRATFSVLPTALADEIGVFKMGQKYEIELADGRHIDMDVGVAIFHVLDRVAPSTVLVGSVPEPIPGVETLEALGLTVDPSEGKLVAKRAYSVRLGGIR